MEIDDVKLNKEWLQLSKTNNPNGLKDLEFDKWWKEILSIEDPKIGVRFPHLCTLANVIRSLPDSNADAKCTFSASPDILKEMLTHK